MEISKYKNINMNNKYSKNSDLIVVFTSKVNKYTFIEG